MILGIAFMVIILVLVQFVSNPPDNYIPEEHILPILKKRNKIAPARNLNVRND